MLDFFSTLITYISLVWDYFLNFIKILLQAILTLAQVVTVPQFILSHMPPLIATSVIIVSGVAVFKLILGWSGES